MSITISPQAMIDAYQEALDMLEARIQEYLETSEMGAVSNWEYAYSYRGEGIYHLSQEDVERISALREVWNFIEAERSEVAFQEGLEDDDILEANDGIIDEEDEDEYEGIPVYVLDSLKAVRDSGVVNMLAMSTVLPWVGSQSREWIGRDYDRYISALKTMGKWALEQED